MECQPPKKTNPTFTCRNAFDVDERSQCRSKYYTIPHTLIYVDSTKQNVQQAHF